MSYLSPSPSTLALFRLQNAHEDALCRECRERQRIDGRAVCEACAPKCHCGELAAEGDDWCRGCVLAEAIQEMPLSEVGLMGELVEEIGRWRKR